MKAAHEDVRPCARREGLLSHELMGEVVVYDQDRHRACCLNPTAAAVWKKCDGASTPREIAQALQSELETPVSEAIVWLAINQLERNHLLQNRLSRSTDMSRMSRRTLMRKVGLAAAVSLPIITTLVAPTAAQAGTPLPDPGP